MNRVFNPLSRLNVGGMVVAALSPCLLGVQARGESWIDRHILFVLVLALGLVMAALRRKVIVGQEEIVVVAGFGPFSVARRKPVSRFDHVTVDAGWSKGGTTYEAALSWTDPSGRSDTIRLLKGERYKVDEACKLAAELSIRVITTASFARDAEEEVRKEVERFNSSPAGGPNRA